MEAHTRESHLNWFKSYLDFFHSVFGLFVIQMKNENFIFLFNPSIFGTIEWRMVDWRKMNGKRVKCEVVSRKSERERERKRNRQKHMNSVGNWIWLIALNLGLFSSCVIFHIVYVTGKHINRLVELLFKRFHISDFIRQKLTKPKQRQKQTIKKK